MSGLRRAMRHPDRGNDPHNRAHELASDRLLEALHPQDAMWLDAHLAACDRCRALALAFEADRDLLFGLRDAPIAAPRDLGARLSGALDVEVRESLRAQARRRNRPARLAHAILRERATPPLLAERRRGGPVGWRFSQVLAGVSIAALIAVLVLPVAFAPGIRPGTPGAAGPSSAANALATPMRIGADPVAYVKSRDDGRFVIMSAPVNEVCAEQDAAACGTLDTAARTLVTLDVEPSAVVLGKRGDIAVVVSADAVYAVTVPIPPIEAPNVSSTQPTASVPAATPTRTGVSTTPPADTPVPSGSPVDTASPTPGTSSPATGSPTPPGSATAGSPTPTVTSATESPDGASQTPAVESASPSAVVESPSPTASSGIPGASDTPTAGSSPPVTSSETPPAPETPGPDETSQPVESQEPTPPPAPSPDPTIPPPTPAPTAARTLAIAQGVVVTGAPAAYSPDGRWVAFSARPIDGSAGPDVYAWRVGSQRATKVTHDGTSQFSMWFDNRLVISTLLAGGQPATRVADPVDLQARSSFLDPATGTREVVASAAWRPVVDPTHRRVVWWQGSFEWNAATSSWEPARGRLVIGDWTAMLEGTTEVVDNVPWSAGAADGATWDARWDPSGRRLAVWVSDGPDTHTGRLSLFTVNADGSLGQALLKEAASVGSFSLDAERLAWATPPGQDGQGSALHVLAWTATGDGQLKSLPDPQGPVIVSP